MTSSTATYDLSDPSLQLRADLPAVWRELRAGSPVPWTDRPGGTGFWSVLNHAAAGRVLKDPAGFTSTKGMRLDANPAATAGAANKMLIVTDPPRHGAIRRVVNSAFTPRMVARLEENIRRTAAEIVDRALADRDTDLTRVAARLPVSVICDLLGVPAADQELMLTLTSTAFGSEAEDPAARARAAEAHTEMLLYYDDLLTRRRRAPQEDIVSALAHGTVDGRPLTDEEVFLNCDGLVSGGNETTRHTTVGGLLALVEHPEQWQRLRADPALVPGAVEEILRWTAPALHVLRTATKEVEVDGARIAAGEQVAVWLPAANRDGAVFAEAERFDVGRTPNPHLTFAAGTHFCLGAALARTELRLLFEELVRRVGEVRPAGPVRRLRSTLIWGYESAPVTVLPR